MNDETSGLTAKQTGRLQALRSAKEVLGDDASSKDVKDLADYILGEADDEAASEEPEEPEAPEDEEESEDEEDDDADDDEESGEESDEEPAKKAAAKRTPRKAPVKRATRSRRS